jgi:1,2-diacylglycerol-3-alpha-glucose alpha-1,2-glucosyltransferase
LCYLRSLAPPWRGLAHLIINCNCMKVCLYLEFLKFARGFFYRRAGTGFLTSFKNYLKALELNGVEITQDLKDKYDVLHVNLPFLRSLWAIRQAKKRGIKTVISSHATAEDLAGVWRISSLIRPLVRRYYRFAYGTADVIISPTEYTKNLLKNYGLPASKIEILSSGVDFSEFEVKEKKYQKSQNDLVIFNVANAIPRKGIDSFIYLAKEYPQNKFYWYGKVFKSILYKPIPKNLPANLEFKGYAPDILKVYREEDIFVFPSYEENQGLVILEAAASGLPILIRDLPVYDGWLINEKNCLKAKNDEEFGTQLGRLISDSALRERLGKEAREMAKSHDLKIIGQKLIGIYSN